MRRFLKWLLIALIAVPLFGAVYLLSFGLRIDEGTVFLPRPYAERDGLSLDREARLDGYDIAHERVQLGGRSIALTQISHRDGADRPLIVSCFGNASDRRMHGVTYAEKLLPHGDVLLWDYPGYADSEGPVSVDAVAAAATDLVALADARAGNRPLVLWGHSLGGFICSQMVARSDGVDALVLETTAPGVEAVAEAWTPARLPIRVRFDEALLAYDTPDALADFTGPILIIGGGRDRVLPVALSRQLADALPHASYLELPDATHYSAGFDPKAQAAVAQMIAGLAP